MNSSGLHLSPLVCVCVCACVCDQMTKMVRTRNGMNACLFRYLSRNTAKTSIHTRRKSMSNDPVGDAFAARAHIEQQNIRLKVRIIYNSI
jgi:hypothetical protein